VLDRAVVAVRGWLRELRDARAFGRACRLIERGRLPEAAEALKALLASLDAAGPAGPFASRFVVAQALSTTAARLGDQETTLAALHVALPLWREVEPTLRSEETRRDLTAWAEWAEKYERAAVGR